MRKIIGISALVLAIGMTTSACVIVSGNKVDANGGFDVACNGSEPMGGLDRSKLMEATEGFEKVERLQVICANNSTSRTLLKVSGVKTGGGHADRTFIVRASGLEPVL